MGHHGEAEPKVGLSRRAALRAGVAAGVGVAAWSGASITSLGGTPAYAAGCTFAIPPIDISGGCRNTDQGCDPFGYHTLKTDLGTGYAILNNIAEGVCCNAVNPNPTFTFPAGQTCTVTLLFGDAPGKCDGTEGTIVTAPQSDGSIEIPLLCYPSVSSSTFYTITARCWVGGVGDEPPSGCF